MPAADTPPSAGCPNCGAPFVPERRPYCPECGQETQIRAPRIGEFIQQFGGAYLSTEGALWRTLKLLLPAVLVIPGYAGLAFRRVYGGRAWGLVWRGALLSVVHLMLVLVIVAVTALVALLI